VMLAVVAGVPLPTVSVPVVPLCSTHWRVFMTCTDA
jgi:hypothetical protein